MTSEILIPMPAHSVHIYTWVLPAQKFCIHFVLVFVDRLDIKDRITSKTLFLFLICSGSLDYRYFRNSMTSSILLINIIVFKILAIDPTMSIKKARS